MIIHTIETKDLAVKTYLIVDPTTKKGAVIDPTLNINPLLALVEKEKYSIIAIVETHVHADFVSGSRELKDHLGSEAKIYCSALGGDEWTASYCDVAVGEREEIILGDIRLEAWHTPGHTPEHVMWVVFEAEKPAAAFTGDFLFFNSVGRPDLLGNLHTAQLAEALYHSVFSILPQLPDSLIIYPAHGAGSLCGKLIGKEDSSTLGIQRKTNLYLREMSKEKWIQNILQGMPPAPAYFSHMKRVNVEGPPLLKELAPLKQLISKELVDHIGVVHTTLIDVRNKEEFALAHAKGAINIPYQGSFLNWISLVISQKTHLIIIAKDEKQLNEALATIKLVFPTQVIGTFIWDPVAIAQYMGAIESFPMLSTLDLLERLQNGDLSLMMIDVRTDQEWNSGHLARSKHIELQNILKEMPSLPRNYTLGIICGSGYRASIAASMLQKEGFTSVFNVQGGMAEWSHRGFPVKED